MDWTHLKSGNDKFGGISLTQIANYHQSACEFTKKMQDIAWSPTKYDICDPEKWGFYLSKDEESNNLQVSNYEVISRDLIEKFPDDVRVVTVSLCDRTVCAIAVRAFNNDGTLTEAFINGVVHWVDRLEKYKIADDEDFNNRQLGEAIDSVMAEAGVSNNDARKILSWIARNRPDDLDLEDETCVSEDAIAEAMEVLHINEKRISISCNDHLGEIEEDNDEDNDEEDEDDEDEEEDKETEVDFEDDDFDSDDEDDLIEDELDEDEEYENEN